MRFEDAIHKIGTGDIIAVRSNKTLLNKLTRFFTHADHVHVGLAVWLGDELWIGELNGGRDHIIPIQQLRYTEFDVIDCPVPDRAEIRKNLMLDLGEMTDYSIAAFMMVGFVSFFKLNLFVHWRSKMVCTGFVIRILEKSGLPEMTRIISPSNFVKKFGIKLRVNDSVL